MLHFVVGACIVEARLFCLDCHHKDTEVFQSLDLCGTQEYIAARLTNLWFLKVAHEPELQARESSYRRSVAPAWPGPYCGS